MMRSTATFRVPFGGWTAPPITTVFAAALLLGAAPARAQSVADFYRGKTINFLVGSGEGGGFDLSARLSAAYLGRYLPGNPTIVVQNMPGASGLRVAEYMYNVAPRDGTAVAITQPSIVLHKVLNPTARFNPLEYNFIGRVASFVTFGVVWHTSPVQSLDDAKTREVVLGAVGPSGPAVMASAALNQLAGSKIRIVKGYKSASELGLAMERGEVQGSGSSAYEYLQSKGWVDKKLIKPIFTIGLQRNANAPDTPTLVELVPDQRGKTIIRLAASASDIGRAIIAPPGVPAERVAALRQAFEQMVKGPEFIAESERRHFDLDPISADELAKIVATDMATPADVVEAGRSILEAGN